jgi:hypothetical protein
MAPAESAWFAAKCSTLPAIAHSWDFSLLFISSHQPLLPPLGPLPPLPVCPPPPPQFAAVEHPVRGADPIRGGGASSARSKGAATSSRAARGRLHLLPRSRRKSGRGGPPSPLPSPGRWRPESSSLLFRARRGCRLPELRWRGQGRGGGRPLGGGARAGEDQRHVDREMEGTVARMAHAGQRHHLLLPQRGELAVAAADPRGMAPGSRTSRLRHPRRRAQSRLLPILTDAHSRGRSPPPAATATASSRLVLQQPRAGTNGRMRCARDAALLLQSFLFCSRAISSSLLHMVLFAHGVGHCCWRQSESSNAHRERGREHVAS